jgi:hypothetical protein
VTPFPMEIKHLMKGKIITLGVIFILLIVLNCTHSCTNLWYLLTENGYFIPQESSVFLFNATMMNSGSGGWWIYGEDKKYYYAFCPPGYIKLKKGNETENFDKFNYQTWGKNSEYIMRE